MYLQQSGGRRSDVAFAGVLVALGSAALAGGLAFGAVLVHRRVLGALGGAGAADVGAQRAKVAVVGRSARHHVQGGGADVRAVEVDRDAFAVAIADVACDAGLAGPQRFLAGLDTGLNVCHFAHGRLLLCEVAMLAQWHSV
ncbi:hypothetical protein MASSI9I_50747 [Massilia sp. 9I]|nr:hypothetical protein MASSI9I_50747 [Massilia sp. 9I]